MPLVELSEQDIALLEEISDSGYLRAKLTSDTSDMQGRLEALVAALKKKEKSDAVS